MVFKVFSILIFLLTFSDAHKLKGLERKLKKQYENRWVRTELRSHVERKNGLGEEDMFFEQKVDHFDAENHDTYKQRYWVNDTFYKPGGPVYLGVGGEGPAMDGSFVSYIYSNAYELAPETGALIFAIEHRYYGHSVPVPDLSNENMRFCSSHQALADLANFVGEMGQKYNLSEAKWITFGGSYPGMLSGWARLKFPTAVYGSIANSAPVLAKLDMVSYMDIVSDTLRYKFIGGSDECHENVASGHQTIADLLNSTIGPAILEDKFNFCPDPTGENSLINRENQISWAGMGVIEANSQYNHISCGSHKRCLLAGNIGAVCKEMLNDTMKSEESENVLDRLAYISSVQNEGKCINLTESGAEDKLIYNTTISDDSWIRVWIYQTCAEFAFYQTCEVGSDCPFTQGLMSLNNYLETCQKAFAITEKQVMENVEFSNSYYGGNQPEGSRVFWVNGDVDPWHDLSVLKPISNDQNSLMVKGGSHCEWMSPTSFSTNETDLIAAKHMIKNMVKQWLRE